MNPGSLHKVHIESVCRLLITRVPNSPTDRSVFTEVSKLSAECNHSGVLALLLTLNVKFASIFREKTLNMRVYEMHHSKFYIKHSTFSQYLNIFAFDTHRYPAKGEIAHFLYLCRKRRNLQ
jgi:hypothetical protein